MRCARAIALMRLFQPLGVEAEFLGHLDQFLRSFRILDGFGEPSGPVGLFSIMVGLGHRSTFSDKYGLRQKGSTADRASNGILRTQSCRKRTPCSFQENKGSLSAAARWMKAELRPCAGQHGCFESADNPIQSG